MIFFMQAGRAKMAPVYCNDSVRRTEVHGETTFIHILSLSLRLVVNMSATPSLKESYAVNAQLDHGQDAGWPMKSFSGLTCTPAL